MSNAAIQRMVEREFFIVYDDVIRDIKDPVAIALYCDLLSYASTNSTGSPSLRQLASDIGFSTKNLSLRDIEVFPSLSRHRLKTAT